MKDISARSNEGTLSIEECQQALDRQIRGTWDWAIAKAQLDVALFESGQGGIDKMRYRLALVIYKTAVDILEMAESHLSAVEYRSAVSPVFAHQREFLTIYIQVLMRERHLSISQPTEQIANGDSHKCNPVRAPPANRM